MPVWRMSKHWLCEGIVDKLWQIICYNKTKLYLSTPNVTSNHSLCSPTLLTDLNTEYLWGHVAALSQSIDSLQCKSNIVNANYSVFEEMRAYTIIFFGSGFLHFTHVMEVEGQKYSIQLQHHTEPFLGADEFQKTTSQITLSSTKQRNRSKTGQKNYGTKKKVAKIHFQLIFLYTAKSVMFKDDTNYNTTKGNLVLWTA